MVSPVIIAAIAAIVLVPILLVIAIKIFYKTPAADEALVITGFGAKASGAGDKQFKIVTAGGAPVLPGLQRLQSIPLRTEKAELRVEGVDNQKIPIRVRGIALFKVGNTHEEITNAATRFLTDHGGRGHDATRSQMQEMVQEVLHGHLRSIIGGLTVEDLIANRNELAQQTRDASTDEMQKLGLVIDSLQIAEVENDTGYITALGEVRDAAVKREARIAIASADREATEREQEANRLKAAAERDTEIALAKITAEQDRERATAAQAGPLAEAEARKQVVITETQVADLEAQREAKRLETTVNKPADAEAYRIRVNAEADRDSRILAAEAAKQEVELQADAEAKRVETVGNAEAATIKAKGQAEGDAVRARGLAEAEAIAKRGEALERGAAAVIDQQLVERWPEIVRAAASSISEAENVTILNGATGVNEIVNSVLGQAGPTLELARQAFRDRRETPAAPAAVAEAPREPAADDAEALPKPEIAG